ncbi:MAG: coenzyme F420 hydrogenase subunit beta [Promethearchaeota archaeon CR_4]|nr:MAG: coenzyme F420 hydrogenase subunit beta [Candidatus Lokiarchaeota archaeon CR_4]
MENWHQFPHICENIEAKEMQENTFEKSKLDAAYYAVQSFRVRCLVDSREDILKTGRYTEENLDNMTMDLFAQELHKFQFWQKIKNSGSMKWDQIIAYARETGQAVFDVVRQAYEMKYEGLASIEELNGQFSQITATAADPGDIRPIYDQVSKISPHICSGCGMCAGICPLGCITVENGKLTIDETKCIHCGLCFTACPRSFLPKKLVDWLVSHGEAAPVDVQIGSYLEALSAQTKVPDILTVGQDGGVVTTLLYYAFQAGKIDAALGAKMGTTLWKPEPFIMRTKEDAILAAGTKYANNPNLSALPQVKKFSKIAVVGTPCMMQALRKGDIFKLDAKLRDQIKYKIGIFCMESFPYEGIVQIAKQLGTSIENAKKMNINQGKFFITNKDGTVVQAPIKEVTQHARKECHYCYDLTSESADISVGSIGSPAGWSSVLVRTPAGKELFDGALAAGLLEVKKLAEIQPGLPLLVKIAGTKSNNSSKKVLEGLEKKHPVPAYK